MRRKKVVKRRRKSPSVIEMALGIGVASFAIVGSSAMIGAFKK